MTALDTYRTAAATIRPFSDVKATTVISERQGDALRVTLRTDGIEPEILRFLANKGLGIDYTQRQGEYTEVKCSM